MLEHVKQVSSLTGDYVNTEQVFYSAQKTEVGKLRSELQKRDLW